MIRDGGEGVHFQPLRVKPLAGLLQSSFKNPLGEKPRFWRFRSRSLFILWGEHFWPTHCPAVGGGLSGPKLVSHFEGGKQ